MNLTPSTPAAALIDPAGACVTEILIAVSAADAVTSLSSAQAIPGAGIAGDRYATGRGTFSHTPQRADGELTLVQQEHIDEFSHRTGIAFTSRDARRNLVTRGVDLNALVGRDFLVGEVRVRGHRLCEPCNTLAKRTAPEVLKGLVHRGGLRAQILSAGTIRVGDAIVADGERA